MHEASLYDENVFVTLTYDNDRLPAEFDGRSLCREHVQLFLKRLRDHAVRKRGRSFRFVPGNESRIEKFERISPSHGVWRSHARGCDGPRQR